MLQMTVTTRGYPQAISYINRVRSRLQSDTQRGLIRAVNRIGDIWKANFDSEGAAVGGWADLTEYTNAIREWQGFSPEHPILKRSGILEEVVIDSLVNATGAGSVAKSDGYSGSETRSSIALDDGVVTIDAHGWKVSNNEEVRGKYGHPARPFWFVDKSVVNAAQSGIVDWIVKDVLDASGLGV